MHHEVAPYYLTTPCVARDDSVPPQCSRKMLRFASKSAAAIGVGLGVQAALRPKPNLDDSKAEDVDALIIGGGIMGATVALIDQATAARLEG